MKADLLIHHARVFTADSTRPWTDAVACVGNQIIATGTNDEIRAWADSKTKLVNARGRLVLPGLIDSHVHFLEYAIRRHQINLFDVDNLEEVRERVRRAVQEAEPGTWILGWGWSEERWDDPPSRALLDDIAPDNPIMLNRLDMHTFWLNSAALKRANLSAETPDPPESRLERDASGQLTGILREWNALKLVEPHIPEPDLATQQAWLEEAITEAHQLGLTGIHDQRVQDEGQQSFRLFQTLRHQGRLNLRVHMNLPAEYLPQAVAIGLKPGFGDDRLWLGHLKLFADGTMGSRTASMLEPFEGTPDNRGLVITSADRLWNLVDQAGRAGFSLSVHAIGNRAVREVLDVLGEAPPDSSSDSFRLPHRIEHVQLIHPDDLPRLNQYNVVASVQPVHICSDWTTADRVWGERARYAYAFRSLLEHGTRLALGSDAPVAPLNPMLGIYAATTRQDQTGQPSEGWYPEERISVGEAVYGYTRGPAYAAGRQGRQGAIVPGYWADLIMLSHNIFEIPATAIPETRVDLTVFDGQIVHYPGGEIESVRKTVFFPPFFGPTEYK